MPIDYSDTLTFAVIGRGEVGEFPQQPSFLSVPAQENKYLVKPKLLGCVHLSPVIHHSRPQILKLHMLKAIVVID